MYKITNHDFSGAAASHRVFLVSKAVFPLLPRMSFSSYVGVAVCVVVLLVVRILLFLSQSQFLLLLTPVFGQQHFPLLQGLHLLQEARQHLTSPMFAHIAPRASTLLIFVASIALLIRACSHELSCIDCCGYLSCMLNCCCGDTSRCCHLKLEFLIIIVYGLICLCYDC